MFERLTGKLLSRLLSKYFVSDDSSSPTGSSPEKKSWSQLGVWSGYVSLESLELRKEVVNSYLKSRGLPFELLQCTLGRVEITVPWAKLGLSSPSAADGDDAVVVIVVDGVHALLRTNYEFDDEALREAAIQERRQELLDAEVFGKVMDRASYSAGLSGFLQKRLAEGILKDVLEKLHIHVRDVHVRLEDVQSDPVNPCAVGVTFESLHVQAEEDIVDSTISPVKKENTQPTYGVIQKVAQLNHFAVYWNALDYGQGLPTELSVLHDTMCMESSAAVAAALDRCIARRAISLSSPLRARPAQTTPNHSFLLRPLDASWHAKLNTRPQNLEERPALETSLHIDDLSLQLRDFQCSQISILASAAKEHSFSKHYRKYRPEVSAKEDPRAWWRYAVRVVRMELHKGNMRWSWSRFAQRYALRRRYCELYERERRYQLERENPGSSVRRSSMVSAIESNTSHPSQDSVFELSSAISGEGASPLTDTMNGNGEFSELSEAEMDELTEMEDGIRGDLSVFDIVLFRALINARVAADKNTSMPAPKSRLRRLMSSFISDDIESEEEYERLMAYLEQAKTTQESLVSAERASLMAVSIHVNLDRGCISLFSPLPSTEDLDQHRRIQQRFLDLSIIRLQLGYSLFGNYESTRVLVSLEDFVGSEIRSNRSVYTIVSRSRPGAREVESGSGTPQSSNVNPAKNDLVSLEMQGSPLDNSDCDIRLHASLEALEVTLLPQGEWFRKIKKLISSKPSTRSLSSFWEDMGMVHINSLTSRRAGLLAKANTVIFAHKNVDLDVFIKLPLLRVSDGGEASLTVDLGHAHFATERLAGVATGKLLVSAMKKSSGESRLQFQQNGDAGNVDQPSCMSVPGSSVCDSTDFSSAKLTPVTTSSNNDPSSPRRDLGDRFFLGGSAMSVIGENRMSTRSFYGNVPSAANPSGEDYPSQMHRGLHSSFYDEFRLEITSTCAFVTEKDDSRRSSLVDNMDVQVSIAKSVIPSDHTLCRVRTQCAIKDISIRLSESSISCIVGLARSWIKAVNTEEPSTSFYMPSVSVRERKMAVRLGLPAFRDVEEVDLREAFSDASSMLDEAEFIDALEGDDNDDATGDWLDDNWIADAESVVDNDIRSVSKRSRSRRKMSMSDVSSISDKSLGTRRRLTNNQYLSAENLARLEELVAEDEGDSGSDADSFQSALSLGGQRALANEVEEHIRRAEDEVTQLKSKLATEAKCVDGSPFLIPEARRRSQVRKSLRMEMDRARAELRALRATHEDLLAQLESADMLRYDEQLESDVDGAHISKDLSGNELNARAKALVRARKQRSSSNADDEFKHQLMSGLNRELLRASVVVSRGRIVIDGLNASSLQSEERQGISPSSFEFCISQCVVGILLRAHESRVSASIDGVVASMTEGIDVNGLLQSQHLLLGGSRPLIFDSSRDGYDAPLTAAEDRVLVLTLDRQEKPTSGRLLSCKARATKLRVHVGEVEIVPREEHASSLLKVIRSINGSLAAQNAMNKTRPSDETSGTYLQRLCQTMNGAAYAFRQANDEKTSKEAKVEYADISCRVSSFRVTLGACDNTIGSFVLTDVGARFLRGVTQAAYSSRSQLDVRCNNVQLFDLYHVSMSSMLFSVQRLDA